VVCHRNPFRSSTIRECRAGGKGDGAVAQRARRRLHSRLELERESRAWFQLLPASSDSVWRSVLSLSKPSSLTCFPSKEVGQSSRCQAILSTGLTWRQSSSRAATGTLRPLLSTERCVRRNAGCGDAADFAGRVADTDADPEEEARLSGVHTQHPDSFETGCHVRRLISS